MRAKPEWFPRGTSGRAPERSGGAQRPAGVSRSAPRPRIPRGARHGCRARCLPFRLPGLPSERETTTDYRDATCAAAHPRSNQTGGPDHALAQIFLRRQKGRCERIKECSTPRHTNSFLSGGQEGRPTIRGALRLTYMCSRSCERSEQFARSSDAVRAPLFLLPRAHPHERINGAKRNDSREERAAEHRRRPARRGAEWLHEVIRRFRTCSNGSK